MQINDFLEVKDDMKLLLIKSLEKSSEKYYELTAIHEKSEAEFPLILNVDFIETSELNLLLDGYENGTPLFVGASYKMYRNVIVKAQINFITSMDD